MLSVNSAPRFDLGTFQISGPLVGAEECTLTEACSLQLGGVGLVSTNQLRILLSSESCGADVAGVSTFTGLSSTTTVP